MVLEKCNFARDFPISENFNSVFFDKLDCYLIDIDHIFKIACKGVIISITIFVIVNNVTHENFSFARLAFTSSFQAFCLKILFEPKLDCQEY